MLMDALLMDFVIGTKGATKGAGKFFWWMDSQESLL